MATRTHTRAELVLLGTGIQLGRHITARIPSELQRADTVFTLTDGWALQWLKDLRPDAISLHEHYGDDKDRRETYREMHDRILAELQRDRIVAAVFYGHPAVYADVPHTALRAAREQGIPARMEPGISAEACLYADLGLDPGKRGTQSFEATQFLISQREADPTSTLILWQIALCGDLGCTRFQATPAYLEILVDKLRRWYPAETPCILYEAPQFALGHTRMDSVPLQELAQAHYREHTTLVIPPSRELDWDQEILSKLAKAGADTNQLP